MLEAGLGQRPDGKWAASDVALVVARQNGKGSVLEALELFWLFISGERLILHTAHEAKTAMDGFRRLYGVIRSAPFLEKEVRKVTQSHGAEGIELKSGQSIRFLPRTAGAGRGLSADKIVFDEAFKMPDPVLAALLPTQAAVPFPQRWFTSSAPLPESGSDALRRICRRGRSEDPGRLAYIEYSAHPDAASDDENAARDANPSLGIRIDLEELAGFRGAMSDDAFRREHLTIFSTDDEDAAWQAISRARWIACEDMWSTIDETRGVAIALDVSPDRDRASFVGAGWSRNGGVHLEVIDQLTGTDGVVARAAKFSEEIAIAKGSPAWSLEPDLTKAGVKVRPIGTEEHSQACGDLLDAIDQQQIRHLGSGVAGQPLTDAARNAVFKTYGDASLWARRKSSGDITALVAGTLARWCLIHVEQPAPVYAY